MGDGEQDSQPVSLIQTEPKGILGCLFILPMKILRAGLTGCLASIMTGAEILNTEKDIKKHKAVLRFRTDSISRITEIPFEMVTVRKDIFCNSLDSFQHYTPQIANAYSIKVCGGIHNRSIDNMLPATRWVAPEDFHEQLIDRLYPKIINTDIVNIKNLSANDGPIISTIPMSDLAHMLACEAPMKKESVSKPIYVSDCFVIDCSVHQTIYFPERDTDVYRATLEGSRLIVESIRPIKLSEFHEVRKLFVITQTLMGDVKLNYEQKIGKLSPINEQDRKDFILNATKNHNIYSLGRTATWRNILLNDCVNDVLQIERMIKKSQYDRMLGK